MRTASRNGRRTSTSLLNLRTEVLRNAAPIGAETKQKIYELSPNAFYRCRKCHGCVETVFYWPHDTTKGVLRWIIPLNGNGHAQDRATVCATNKVLSFVFGQGHRDEEQFQRIVGRMRRGSLQIEDADPVTLLRESMVGRAEPKRRRPRLKQYSRRGSLRFSAELDDTRVVVRFYDRNEQRVLLDWIIQTNGHGRTPDRVCLFNPQGTTAAELQFGAEEQNDDRERFGRVVQRLSTGSSRLVAVL